jgi:hypothetical protein
VRRGGGDFCLKTGSDPAMRNKPGSTAFHLAVQNTGRGGSGAPEAISAQRQIIEEIPFGRAESQSKVRFEEKP